MPSKDSHQGPFRAHGNPVGHVSFLLGLQVAAPQEVQLMIQPQHFGLVFTMDDPAPIGRGNRDGKAFSEGSCVLLGQVYLLEWQWGGELERYRDK